MGGAWRRKLNQIRVRTERGRSHGFCHSVPETSTNTSFCPPSQMRSIWGAGLTPWHKEVDKRAEGWLFISVAEWTKDFCSFFFFYTSTDRRRLRPLDVPLAASAGQALKQANATAFCLLCRNLSSFASDGVLHRLQLLQKLLPPWKCVARFGGGAWACWWRWAGGSGFSWVRGWSRHLPRGFRGRRQRTFPEENEEKLASQWQQSW